MSSSTFKYKATTHPEWGYALTEEYYIHLPELAKSLIRLEKHKYVNMSEAGVLAVSKGYAWDGATGVVDTADIMRASLVHDALYQLIRHKRLSWRARRRVDKIFYQLMREDGMSWFRANYIYFGARRLGRFFV